MVRCVRGCEKMMEVAVMIKHCIVAKGNKEALLQGVVLSTPSTCALVKLVCTTVGGKGRKCWGGGSLMSNLICWLMFGPNSGMTNCKREREKNK